MPARFVKVGETSNDGYGSRRLLGAATGGHPDADLACAAIKMAVAARGGVDASTRPGWRTDESRRVERADPRST